MTDYSDLVQKLRNYPVWTGDCHDAADALETQAKRIAGLEHELKVECDTYLWKRKLMSRRIASLQYWMKKLFKYGSSPEAKRNQMTMTTEIPDYLMREGEDILLEILTRALEEEE
jgi:hypothetical protein